VKLHRHDAVKKLILTIVMGISFFFSSAQEIKSLPISNYIEKRNGLGNAYKAIAVRKNARVAFLGGSITFNGGWRDLVCAYLKQRFPDTKFHFIAAGIPSLGSLPHAFRLQRDVLDSGKIDLLFLEAAVNDQVNGTDSITQVRSLEGIVRHAKTNNPLADIVMMSFADPDKTKQYVQGITPVAVANHELVAAHYHLPSINLAKAVSDKIANHEFSWEKDFKDLHPSPFGQELYFSAIKDLLASGPVITDRANSKRKKNSLKSVVLLDEGSFVNGKYLGIEHAIYDSNWIINKNWTPEDGLTTRPGFINVPMLVSTTAGASFTLRFKGNAIGMAIVSGSDTGIVKYSIDNGPEQQMDLFTEWSQSLHLPWYVLFGSDLSNTDHLLKVTIMPENNKGSKGTACRIVNFLVNN
jgi:lysophospholipase L1-like esterase